MSEATAVMEALGEFQVGDRVLLHCEPDHKGFAGTITKFFNFISGMPHVSVLCDIGGYKLIELSASLDELELQ